MSNEIEEIQKLYAKVKSYQIPEKPKEGEEPIMVEITPLALDDMSSLNMTEKSSPEEIAKNAVVLFSKSLKMKEEDVKKISVRYMEDMMNAVMDANNFKEEDMKKTGIKSFIESKQAQINKEKDDSKSAQSA